MNYLEILKRTEDTVERKGEETVPAAPKPPTMRGAREELKQPFAARALGLPDSVLLCRNPLAELCRTTLDSNPVANKLTADDRRWIAEHLQSAVLGWLQIVFQPEQAWEATCPKGHPVTDGIFARCLLGWCCERCRSVYRPEDCRLNRGSKK